MKISLYISRYITIIRWYTEKSRMWIFGTILKPILNDTFWSTLRFLVKNFVSYFILFWKDFQGLKCKQPKGIEQQAGRKKERITKNRPIMKLALFFLWNFSISKTDCIRMGMWWFYAAEQVISTTATCSPQKWVSQDNGRLFFLVGAVLMQSTGWHDLSVTPMPDVLCSSVLLRSTWKASYLLCTLWCHWDGEEIPEAMPLPFKAGSSYQCPLSRSVFSACRERRGNSLYL